MAHADLPLFAWTPPRRIVMFPLDRKVGRVRDVAEKMLDKPTDRAAASYRNQVTDGMLRAMERLGIPEPEQDEQLGAFWDAVQAEMLRILYRGRRPGGDAA